jgi:hypothetical protein
MMGGESGRSSRSLGQYQEYCRIVSYLGGEAEQEVTGRLRRTKNNIRFRRELGLSGIYLAS